MPALYEKTGGKEQTTNIKKIKFPCTEVQEHNPLKVPMKRNFSFFLTKEHKKSEDCRLPFLNILFGSGVTKL